MSIQRLWDEVDERTRALRASSRSWDTAVHKSKIVSGHASSLWSARCGVNSTPLDGYDPEDYRFLPSDDQQRLKDAIEEYQTAESSAPADRHLQTIRQILQQDDYPCWEAFVLEFILKSRPDILPAWVFNRTYRAGRDSEGQAALWVSVMIDEEAVRRETNYPANLNDVERTIVTLGEDLPTERWFYVAFTGPDDEQSKDADTAP